MTPKIAQVEESDFPDIARIDEVAMKENGVTQAIGKTLAAEGRSRTDFFTSYIRSNFDQHRDTFWKVVDSDNNEMISFAKFTFEYNRPESEEDDKGDDNSENGPPPSERLMQVMMKLSAVGMEFARANYAGRPHASLSYLATHPEHQRRGAASMLMEQGTRIADEAGLDTFLQASEEGLELYKKYGFEVVRTDSLDLAEFGVDKVEVRSCMKRPARTSRE